MCVAINVINTLQYSNDMFLTVSLNFLLFIMQDWLCAHSPNQSDGGAGYTKICEVQCRDYLHTGLNARLTK